MTRRLPRFLVGFDTEDDSDGHPFLWAFTHTLGSWWTTNRDDALSYLENLTREQKAGGKQVECWATNLEYDLCNLFPPERVAELTLRFGRAVLCGARWRGCDFRDTMRHLPVSVADLGELVGLPKLQGDLFKPGETPTFDRYVERCQRDATITYRAAKRFHASYRRFGEHARMTLASTALAIWQRHYFDQPLRRPAREVWHAAREAYHGGRTEAFAVGSFPDVTAIDVASMFPWAMIASPFPLPWGAIRRVEAGGAIEPHGIYRVRVRSSLARPRLPVRTREGTIYPNGTWVGWYVGEELIAFQKAGGHARVLRGFRFLQACDPFKGYVREMFQRKNAARGMDRIMFKLLLNSLYGKFGQKGRLVRAVPLERFLLLRKAPLSWRAWNGLAIYSENNVPPIWGNNVWAAFVTARARVRLADEMESLSNAGCRALYCDTDSVIYQGNGPRYPQRATRPGTFELRGRFARLLVVGKKEYALDKGGGSWECHAKGVPFAERYRYLTEGRASFQRPTRLREAARDGSIVNQWRTVEKIRRHRLGDKARKADGALPVTRITRAPEVSARE